MLTNVEVWYGITKGEIDELEEIDKLLIRRILEAPTSACIESLYLELGLIPIRFIIMARRVNFLQSLLKMDTNDMCSKMLRAQWEYPVKNDWTKKVQEDLNELNIDLSLEEIKKKSENSFKRLVKIKTEELALDYLLNLKENHTKMDNIHYSQLKMQMYLKSDKIPVNEAKNIYKFRTRVAKFKENFKNGNVSIACPMCHLQPDTQEHSLVCQSVKSKITIEGAYSDIFQENVPSNLSKTLMKIIELRKDLM